MYIINIRQVIQLKMTNHCLFQVRLYLYSKDNNFLKCRNKKFSTY